MEREEIEYITALIDITVTNTLSKPGACADLPRVLGVPFSMGFIIPARNR